MLLPLEEIDRIRKQGNAALRLLQDEDFAEVLNALSDYHLAAMVACPTGTAHAETRDHHHRSLATLREIHGEIEARARALNELEGEQEDDTE